MKKIIMVVCCLVVLISACKKTEPSEFVMKWAGNYPQNNTENLLKDPALKNKFEEVLSGEIYIQLLDNMYLINLTKKIDNYLLLEYHANMHLIPENHIFLLVSGDMKDVYCYSINENGSLTFSGTGNKSLPSSLKKRMTEILKPYKRDVNL